MTRYWYQVISQANVRTSSLLTPGERDDRDQRLAERARDALDRAPEEAGVEEVGRLDERGLRVGQPAQQRLGDDRLGLLWPGRREAAPSVAAFCRECGEIARDIGPPSRTQP